MKQMARFVIMVLLSHLNGMAAEPPAVDPQPKGRSQRISYSLGFQIGEDFKDQSSEMNAAAFMAGVQDALMREHPELARDEMHAILLKMKKQLLAKKQEDRVEMRESVIASGRKFMSENAGKDGVISLPSGLQYRIVKAGKGRTPTLADRVVVRYRGTLTDGTEIGSSQTFGGTQTLRVSNVVPGMTEALMLMKEGASWQLFLPPDLAYGHRGVLAGRTVIYDLELVSVLGGEE